jgi:hypothetical protein
MTGHNSEASPMTGHNSDLFGVAATSSTNAWAVGDDGNGALIEHWNGRAWSVQASPKLGDRDGVLRGVVATSSTNAWVVGYADVQVDAASYTTAAVIEHWNGRAWSIQAWRDPYDLTALVDVTATSSMNAWAVGYGYVQEQFSPSSYENYDYALIMHWNGRAWKEQASPNPLVWVLGVTATSSGSAWAVGSGPDISSPAPIGHWNGRAWSLQASPSTVSESTLFGAAATSSRDAWAVGASDQQVTASSHQILTLIEHWDGRAWSVEPSPSAGSESRLFGVAATPARNAWAVGYTHGPGHTATLAVHCG